MEKKITEIKNLKPGGFCIIDDVVCKVDSVTKSKPGKHGGAKARLVVTGLFDSQKRNLVKPADTKIDVPIIEKRAAQIVSLTGKSAQVMDMEDYSMSEVTIPEDVKIKEGDEIILWKFGPNILVKGKK